MRGLYQVYIVDPESEKPLAAWGPMVAASEENAQTKALAAYAAALEGKDIDALDFCVVYLGAVRNKQKVQTVKIIKD